MSHHKTLNTRLLPLSILISSLVSGGAVAASTTEFTPGATLGIANGGSFLVTDNIVAGAPEEKSIFAKLSDYLKAGFITQDQKDKWQENLEKLYEKKTAAANAQAAAVLATEAKEKAIQNLAKMTEQKADADKDVAAKTKAIQDLESTLSTNNDEKKNAIKATGLVPDDADIATQVTDRVTKSEKELEEKKNVLIEKTTAAEAAADAKTQHEAKIKKFDEQITKLDKELTEANDNKTNVLVAAVNAAKDNKDTVEADNKTEIGKAKEKHESTKGNLSNSEDSIKNTAIADQKAYNDLAKAFDEAIAAAEKAVADKEVEIRDLTTQKTTVEAEKSIVNNEKSALADAVTQATKAKNDAQGAAATAKDAVTKAEAADKAIKAAEAAQQAVTEAQAEKLKLTEQIALIVADLPKAEQAKNDADTDLIAKSNELDTAKIAVKALVDNTLATDLPAVDKTIAQSESGTVTAKTLAINTKVAGGTQYVEKDGKIIGSMVSEDGSVNLVVGAQAHDTVVNKGTINNKGGEDLGSIINDGGQLILAGTTTKEANGADVINIAVSHDAKILEGGTVTVGKDAKIINLSSTKGTVALKDGAKAFNTAIDGGTFTIEGASATNTSLTNATLELADNTAIANNTTVNQGASFNLKGDATTSGTIIKDGGSFTLGDSSTAKGTIVNDGTVTVKDKASISNTELNSANAILTLESGTTATGTKLTDATLELIAGVTADDTQLNGFSHFKLNDNATAKNTVINSDSEFSVSQNATATTTTLNSGKFIVDGTATDTTVNRGEFTVGGTGTANDTRVTGGKFTVYKEATANTTTLDGGAFVVDGTAKNTTVTGGDFIVNSSAKDTTVKGGKFALNKGATANATILNNGEFIVDGSANNTTVKGGKFAVNKGATANATTLNSGEFSVAGTAKDSTVNGGKFVVNKDAMADITTLNSGDFIVNGTANNTTVKGGKFNLMARAQAHKLVVENGSALISGHLVDAVFNGGTAIFDKNANIGGTVIFDKNANIDGTINANKDSIINLHEGVKTAKADLILAGKMELIAADIAQITAKSAGRAAFAGSAGQPAQFAFKNVKLAGGNIDMSKSNAQLTMASLAGKGSFKLGSALNNHANAPLKVTGDAVGDFDIQIDASGTQPTNLNIIDIKGNNTAKFALSNGPVDLGNYKHSLVSDDKGGFKLAADKIALTPSTAGIMAVANTMPVIFNAELSSIQNRLDKQTTAANESGVWLTYLNDSYDVKGTATDFNQKLSGVTLGGDKAIELGNAVLSMGGFASHTSSNIKSDYQSSGSVESNSLGAYAQLLSNSGYYFNSVLKTNQFKQNLSVTSQGKSATGAANFSGMGLAVKAGKHITFDTMYVSPYVALNTFSSGKNQYKLSNGMEAQSQGTRSTTGTLGMNTGYRFVLNNGAEIKPYAIFSVDHDLMASNKVMINKEIFDNSLKGTRANAGVGVNVNLTSNLSIGSEVKVSKGKNIATPMTINMGVAYTF
ncbi:autotransporter protein [Yersinia thracica]|uniref:Autotransporter protein n=1 Tax=Yersinia thracica TaxID=2890319 RepID=A0A0T9QJ01_9GAMM|nr:autotransporter outer membrane beta-barrel domain-containing protein [Yersinia thracica]CNI14241.1 autotransporter protein [Yersinia thracica]